MNDENVAKAVDREFAAKGGDVAEKNRQAARSGFDHAAQNIKDWSRIMRRQRAVFRIRDGSRGIK